MNEPYSNPRSGCIRVFLFCRIEWFWGPNGGLCIAASSLSSVDVGDGESKLSFLRWSDHRSPKP